MSKTKHYADDPTADQEELLAEIGAALSAETVTCGLCGDACRGCIATGNIRCADCCVCPEHRPEPADTGDVSYFWQGIRRFFGRGE